MKDFASFEGREEIVREAEKIAGPLTGRSDEDLMKEIYARALAGKRNGTLKNEQIDAFCAQISPMLDAARRKKLQRIVSELKKI